MSLRQRPEFIDDRFMAVGGLAATGLGAAQTLGWVNAIPLDKPLVGLLMQVELRAGVTAAGGAVNAEAAFNFLQRVQVTGTHKVYGTRDLVNLTGATLATLAQKAAFGTGVQLVSNLPAAGAALAIANYDIRYCIYIPLVPPSVPGLQESAFVVRNDEWSTFNVFATLGDVSAIAAIAGGQAMTFTAFGSAAGVPRVRLSVVRTILGEGRTLVSPALLRQQFLPLNTALTAANLVDAPIQDLTTGFKNLDYLIKTGTAQPAVSAGINAYANLLDTIITRSKLKLDNVTLKDNIHPVTARAYDQHFFGGPLPVGYQVLDTVELHDINTLFRGDKLDRSNKLQLAGDVTVAANQQGEVVEMLVEGDPVLYQPS